MEKKVKVAKAEKATGGLKNIPDNLPGLEMGDVLVITHLPDCRKYPDYAEYMIGMNVHVDEIMRFNLYFGEEYLTTVETGSLLASPSAMERMKSKGYTGDFNGIEFPVYPDMVEFGGGKATNADKKKEDDKKPSKKTYSIVSEKKDPEIIKEMISKVDLNRLRKMISISMERGRTPDEGVFNWYINEWAKNKYEFYLAFGRKLSISTPISFKIDETEMSAGVYELYRKYAKYAATMDMVMRNGGMAAYLDNKMPSGINFFKEYCSEFYKGGMNVSKFFSRLFSDADFDLDFSKLLQNRDVKGNITISIDPYDYLTSSQNMHGWRSCHSLRGAYRAGPYSFCIDSATLVAFRDNGKTYHYGVVNGEDRTEDFGKNAFDGNSKSWRQLIHVDKKTCAAVFSREYPSNKTIDGVIDETRALLETTLANYLGIENVWENYGDLSDMARQSYFDGKIIYHDISSHHYSDIYNWVSLTRQYNIRKALVAPENTDMGKIDITVGAKLKCFKCGKFHKNSGQIICCD